MPPVRVETMAGFLFVNLDTDATALNETAPGIETELLAIAPDSPQRVLSWRRTQTLHANWKVAVENYNECYHCPNVHKAFTTGVVSAGNYRITPRGNIIHHTCAGQSSQQLAYTPESDAREYGSFFSWPVSAIQCYPGRVLNSYRWVPLAVDRTLLIREWWLDQAEPTPQQQEIIDLDWATTVAEDHSIINSVQRGVSSRGYRPGPLIVDPSGSAGVHAENGVAHIHHLLGEALGDLS